MNAEPIWSLVLPEGDRLLAEAMTLDAILSAATTIRSDGENIDGAVVLRAGEYDAGATLAVQQEGLIV